MFFTEEKIVKQLAELEDYRYRDTIAIPEFRCRYDASGEIGEYPDDGGEWGKYQTGDRWKGRDHYLWLAADVRIPAEWAGKKIVGRFQFGQTIGGNIGGFESLLFVNGQPYQGVDSNHQEVFFPADCAGATLSLRFRLWSGLNGYGRPDDLEHQFQMAELSWLDESTDDFYYTGNAAIEAVKALPESSPERHSLLAALNKSFLAIDWSRPGSDMFYRSMAEAAGELRGRLEKLPKNHPVTVRCIGHTHIDVAWLWRLKHTREKSARSFSTVLRLMEQFPEYVFLQTQPQLYEYLKKDYPDIYVQIQDRVREGRWEAGGAMWLEADCNLTSGESLVRQLLYGTRFFRDEFGVECQYLWLPDVFGYSWALPQILVKSGIKMFMTTKISWNQYNRMPHDTFYWRGIDGTEILTHFITTPDPNKYNGAFYYTYNGKVTAFSVSGIWDAYQDKDLNQELILAYGYGDGGGGVNREMLEMRRRLEMLPGVPHVTTGRADEYFDGLAERVAQSEEYVHTWDGELYLELHRGTFTSQAYVKRMNRKLELLYRESEWMSVLSSLAHSDWSLYDGASLLEGWKIILRNQFHDIIPGSSIAEVYEDCRMEYAEAWKIGEDQKVRALQAAVANSDATTGVTVWNGAPWRQSELVVIPSLEGLENGSWSDYSGRKLTSQRGSEGWLVRVEDVPSMGYKELIFTGGQTTEVDDSDVFQKMEQGIATPYYIIEWNAHGQLKRVFDRQAGREVLAEGELGNVWQVFEDKPKSRHEAWDIELYYLEKMRVIDGLKQVKVKETGPLRAVVCFEWAYMDSVISQDMIIYADSRRIDFETRVDWHEQRQLLKVAFPVQVRATEATYDIQYGNVKRATHWNTSWDVAKFETVGHQWADLSERNYGVSLLNDCKYGYDIKDNVMRLTLIKAALFPDRMQDLGEHIFTYSLLPHEGDWYAARTVQEAWALNNPMTVQFGRPAASEFSLFQLSSGNVMIDAVKKAEDSDTVVLRIHEFAGIRSDVEISSDLSISWWQECNLMETPEGQRYTNASIRLHVKPYEIKTVIISFR